MLAEIPIYAIDKDQIQFQRHRCFLNESILSTRIAHAYLRQNPDHQLDTIELYLNVTNQTDDLKPVYLSDFQIRGPGEIQSADLFAFPTAIFAVLRPDQELEMTARCKRGSKTIDGSGYCAAIASYQFVRDATIVEQKAAEISNEYDRTSYLVGDAGRDYRCVPGSDEPEFIRFNIESTGGIPPARIFQMSLTLLRQKLDAFCQALEQRDSAKIDIVESHESFPHWDLTVYQETHTLGALLSAATLIYIGDRVSFCGYLVPHPLDGKIVMSLALKEKKGWPGFARALKRFCHRIIESIEQLAAQPLDP